MRILAAILLGLTMSLVGAQTAHAEISYETVSNIEVPASITVGVQSKWQGHIVYEVKDIGQEYEVKIARDSEPHQLPYFYVSFNKNWDYLGTTRRVNPEDEKRAEEDKLRAEQDAARKAEEEQERQRREQEHTEDETQGPERPERPERPDRPRDEEPEEPRQPQEPQPQQPEEPVGRPPEEEEQKPKPKPDPKPKPEPEE